MSVSLMNPSFNCSFSTGSGFAAQADAAPNANSTVDAAATTRLRHFIFMLDGTPGFMAKKKPTPVRAPSTNRGVPDGIGFVAVGPRMDPRVSLRTGEEANATGMPAPGGAIRAISSEKSGRLWNPRRNRARAEIDPPRSAASGGLHQ